MVYVKFRKAIMQPQDSNATVGRMSKFKGQRYNPTLPYADVAR